MDPEFRKRVVPNPLVFACVKYIFHSGIYINLHGWIVVDPEFPIWRGLYPPLNMYKILFIKEFILECTMIMYCMDKWRNQEFPDVGGGGLPTH